VVDGDLARATPLQPDAQGRFRATVDTGAMIEPRVAHQLTVWAEGQPAAAPLSFRVDRPWALAVQADDPAGDDHGALGPHAGRYVHSNDPSWGPNRQMDLRLGGWSNALFSHEGASASHEGRPVAPGAAVQVDAARHTVTLTLPAAALGGRRSLAGARVWVTT